MKPAWILLVASLGLLAQGPALVRRALSPAPANGWVRLPLDGPAQRAGGTAWIGDAEGRSVPFLREKQDLWAPRPMELDLRLTGRDPSGNPRAEFTLRFPEGWQVREREHLELDFDLVGEGTWACRVEVQRRQEGGTWLTLEGPAAHVFDMGESGQRRKVLVPWDAASYGVTLVPVHGKAPTLKGLSVTACTRPEQADPDAWLEPSRTRRPDRNGQEVWLLELPDTERTVAMELGLKPPAAPLRPELAELSQRDGKEVRERLWNLQGLVWNLPALSTSASRLAFGPAMARRLELALPPGASLDSLKLGVRREVLLFPAEAGRAYFLHLGGEAKPAPGNLDALPASSRGIYQGTPLALGPAEPDPQGLAPAKDPGEPWRKWMPWFAGLAVLVLGIAAWRLLQPKSAPGAHPE